VSWYQLPATVPWLTLVVALPLAGALLVLLAPSAARLAIKQLALLTTVFTLILVALLIGGFQQGTPGLQFDEHHAWITTLGISYHLGVDGLSLFLLGLNALLFLLALAITDRQMPRFKEFMILMLVLEAATAGVLVSLDLILFYVFWEAMLVPLYFLVGAWGEGRRIYAAFKFLIYTVLGSFFMLVAILALAALNANQTGQLTFDWSTLVQHPLSGDVDVLGIRVGIQLLLFLGFAVAFAVKMPLFPLHTWLPPAYTATPVPTLLIFAGLISKLGAYGFLRFNLSLFPAGTRSAGPTLATLAVIGLLYGAFMALVQSDLKRLVAYASMSHLGFIGLGIFSQNLLGVEGALIQMINHGLIIAALFLIVAMIERRAGTRDRSQLRGLEARTPLFAALFLVVSLAALGLPGLNGFVGEFLIMLGAWSRFLPLAVGAGIGVILAAWYVLRMYQGAVQEAPPQPATFAELGQTDVAVLAPLLALMVLLGVAPAFFPAAVQATVLAVVSR